MSDFVGIKSKDGRVLYVETQALTGDVLGATQCDLNLPAGEATGLKEGMAAGIEMLRDNIAVEQGQAVSELQPVLQTDTSALAVQAAQVGLGVCLVQSSLLAQPLADGSLQLLSDLVLPSHNGYYAVQLNLSKRSDLYAFGEWLSAQAAPCMG